MSVFINAIKPKIVERSSISGTAAMALAQHFTHIDAARCRVVLCDRMT